MAVAVSAALDRIAAADDLRNRLADLRAHAGQEICSRFDLPQSTSQIIPVILGDDHRTMRIAEALQAAGFDVRGIRQTTDPLGTSRLRFSLTLNVNEEYDSALGAAMAKAREEGS